MKINKINDKKILENYIDIYYNKVDSETARIFNLLDNEKKIIGRNGEHEEVFSVFSVYYFEIVDKKCFAYLESSVYLIELSLQNILENFNDDGFVRISKSMIINVFKLMKIKSDLNMRVNAILENGETVIVNRSYKREFYKNIRALFERSEKNEID